MVVLSFIIAACLFALARLEDLPHRDLHPYVL